MEEKKDRVQPPAASKNEAEEEDPFADLHHLSGAEFNAAVRERVDKLLDDCIAEGQQEAAANGNRNGTR